MCENEGVAQAKRKMEWEAGESKVNGRCTLVLNSMSAVTPNFSHLAVQVSPSSITILPNSIPRAYMFGMEIT